jgi:WD40 repeat protein
VGSWLYGVAYRVALQARTVAARKRAAERRVAPKSPVDPLAEVTVREAQVILDEELTRLPEKYRAPLVLCCLEGATRDEAALRLGWPSSLVKSRLEEGRQWLRRRLNRRGLTLSTSLTAAFLAEGAAPAAAPALVLAATVKGALPSATGKVVGGTRSANVAALADAACKALAVTKVKTAAILLIGLGVLAAGAGIVAQAMVRPRAAQAVAESAERSKAEQVPDVPRVRRDWDGEPLPDEAIARLGTTRFRHGGDIMSLQFTPDGKWLISCGIRTGARIWEAATGKEIQRFPEQAQAERLSLSPDGTLLALLDPRNGPVVIRDFASGRVLRRFGKSGSDLLFSPDGKVLAAFRWTDTIQLWDARSGRLLHTLNEHQDIVWSVAFSPDSKTLISCGDDQTIRFWDVATGKQLRQINHSNGIGTIALSPDGKLLASLDVTKTSSGGGSTSWEPDNRIRLWDVDMAKELRQLKIPVKEIEPGIRGGFVMAFAPDGKAIVTGEMGGVVRIWDLATGRERRRFTEFVGTVSAFAFAPDGKSLAVVDGQGSVRLIDLASGKNLVATHGHRGYVSSVAVTPDCQAVVTLSADGTLRFWDPATGRELQRRTLSTTFDLSQFLPDGKSYLAAGKDGLYSIHDIATGKELGVLRGVVSRRRFALSPDHKALASVGSDQTVCLLDAGTGKPRHTLMKVDGPDVSGISFSADGRLLVVWTADMTVTVWDATTGKKLRQFAGPDTKGRVSGDGACATLSPDGRLLAFGFHQQGIVPVVDTATGEEVCRFAVAERAFYPWAFSPDGRTLASVVGEIGTTSTVYLGEIATGRERRRFTGHRGAIFSLAFAADGKTLVSGGRDTTAMVWDLSGRLAAGDKWGRPLSADELKTQWTILAGTDAAAAYRAIQVLAADPVHSVPYLRERLHPVASVEEKLLTELLADLASDQFKVRDKATLELEKLGESAAHALRKALDGEPALDMRRRLERLIEKQERGRWSPAPDRLRTLRALEVLERASTPEARQVLQGLAGGAPGAWLTQDAKGALIRLSNRR